jgi:hypothetical protein
MEPLETMQKFGLEHGACGRLGLLSDAQMHLVVDFSLTEFHTLRPAS